MEGRPPSRPLRCPFGGTSSVSSAESEEMPYSDVHGPHGGGPSTREARARPLPVLPGLEGRAPSRPAEGPGGASRLLRICGGEARACASSPDRRDRSGRTTEVERLRGVTLRSWMTSLSPFRFHHDVLLEGRTPSRPPRPPIGGTSSVSSAESEEMPYSDVHGPHGGGPSHAGGTSSRLSRRFRDRRDDLRVVRRGVQSTGRRNRSGRKRTKLCAQRRAVR